MKRLGCGLLLLVVCVLAFILMLTPHVFAPPLLLLFGWLFSLNRLVEAWHPSLQPVVLFAFAALALVAGGHSFMYWLHGGLRQPVAQDGAASGRWRWKWTLCGYGIGFCALLAILSLVLTTHQLYWMSRSPEPWFIRRMEHRITLLQATHELQRAAETNQWDSAKTRVAFWQSVPHKRSGIPAGELLQPIWVEKDAQTLRAILLIPRQKPQHSVTRFAIIQPGTNFTLQSLDSLPQVLASFDLNTPVQTPEKSKPLLP